MAPKTQNTPFYLPPGRIVMGDPHTVQTTDQQGREREKPTAFFGVAVPKTDARVMPVIQLAKQVAVSGYQQNAGIMAQINQGLGAPNFAWKIEDGDSEKNRNREGFAGCWIFRFSTSLFPIKCANAQDQPIDPALIECGFYVDVAGAMACNMLTDKNAGIYLNPNCVRLLGYGPVIQQGPTAAQLFAQHQATLPPGASALPVAGNTTPGGAPAVPSPTPPAPPAPPPPAPVAPVAPVMTQEQISAKIAADAGVQHYPGHRLKADRSGYDPDPLEQTVTAPLAAALPTPPGSLASPVPLATSAPTHTTPPAGGATTAYPSDPLAGAGVQGVPAGASPVPAPSTDPLGSTTASPGNPPPPPVSPHPGFLTPPAPRTAAQIQAESAVLAAAAGWPATPGFRPNATRTAWEADPVV